MTDWQSISTAPKDGSFVLLTGGVVDSIWHDTYDKLLPMVVGWFEESIHDPDLGRWKFCSYDGGVYGEYENPKHWAKLPNMP
jgi:hypothetical protein